MLEEAFFTDIQDHFNQGLPFVVYRKPHKLHVTVLLQKEDVLYKINDYSESGFVFSPFDFRKDSILIPFSKSRTLTISREIYNQHSLNKNEFSNAKGKKVYLDLFEKALLKIKSKEFQKLVLSRADVVEMSNIDVIQTLKSMLNTYHEAFVYCWFHPKVGLWLGASPETLIQVEGNRIRTMALAGTQTYDGHMDVAWNSKEFHEQQLVTDYITNVLQNYVDNMEVSEPKTVKAGQLVHLQTTISATLPNRNASLQELILSLHPTSAVCGVPKPEAMQFLLDNENYNREFYSGFLGELNKEAKIETRSSKRNIENRAYDFNNRSTHLFVNLRCMQLQKNKAIIYVGGGITHASDPEMEWEETVQKTKTMKRVIAY